MAEKLELEKGVTSITNSAQIEEIIKVNSNAQVQSTSDIAHVEYEIQVANSDVANSDGEGRVESTTTNIDHSKLTLEEKKKLLWKEKIPAPNRDKWLIKNIFSEKILARRPGKRDSLGVKNQKL